MNFARFVAKPGEEAGGVRVGKKEKQTRSKSPYFNTVINILKSMKFKSDQN